MKRTWKGLCLLLCILFVSACVPKTAYAAVGVQAQAAAVSGTVIEVKWNALDQAAEYAIYRRTSSDADFIKIAQTAALSYRDTGISAGISYYYKIVPISRANGKEMKSAQSTVKTKAPSDVTIERIRVKSQNALQISWSVSEGASGYQIFRSERETGGYKEIGRVNGKTSLRYTDTNVIPGRTYFYRVRPTNQGHTGCGSDSAPYKARTLGQTKITSIASLASDRMQVTWKKVSGAQTYEVYRSARKGSGYRRIATVRSNSRKYLDQSVRSGKKYFYKIVAAGSFDGERITGGYSDPVSYRALQQVKISSIQATADDGLKLKWKKVTGATKYKIFRSESQYSGYRRIATVTGSSTVNYTDRKVVSGKTYYYKVQAYSDGKGVITAGSGTLSEAKGASTAYAIMGETTVTADQMAAVYQVSGKRFPSEIYKDRGAKNIEEFCEVVIEESELEGVRAEVIFAQVCLETGYLQFGGQVSAEQCNFSGIGATDDGAAGATFPDVATGIRAQVQHLKGYASKESLNQPCVDPRFSYLASKRGCARYVQDLGNGNWATDPAYAVKLMTLIKAMKSY